ncbi:hypothetical protein MMC17_006889 [Xylographa soralifera]|nr:hypothetical protein [Xylographa soralifera]MCJ1383775.1 hypothetical protein [Xylographa soralifera]
MNNASSVIWRVSRLGLRAAAKAECTLATRVKGDIFKRQGSLQLPSTSVQSRGVSLWTTISQPGLRVGHSACTKELGKHSVIASQWRKWPNGISGTSIDIRYHSTQPNAFRRTTQHDKPKSQERIPQLSKSRISKILGPGVTLEVGNRLLQTLQDLRRSGRLDEEVTAPGVDEATVAKALAWLRNQYPFDEDGAIMRRIEEEERESDAELLANAERIGIYKPQENVETSKYAKSGLDSIREHYEKQPVKNQADEIRNASQDSAMIQQPNGRAILARRSESAEWVKRYKEKAKLDDLDFSDVAWTTKVKRLLPSTIFLVAVVWFSILLAQNYAPPPKQARLWPDMPPAAATITTIILINATAVVLWRVPPMWRFMNKYFLIIPARPRIWSLLGNTFSHQSPAHFFGNMLVLWFIGTRLHDDIGRGNFLAIYLTGGVFASYVSLCRFVLTSNLITTSLGASGALTAVLAAWCTIHSGEQFRIRFLPPELGPIISLNLLVILLVGAEIMGIIRGYRRIDHWAHLGGYASGFAGAQALKYRARKKREAAQGTTQMPEDMRRVDGTSRISGSS